MAFTAIIRQEAYLYVAECPEVGTVSQGASMEEALANLREATDLYQEEFRPGEYKPAWVEIVPNEFGTYYFRAPDFPALFTGGATPEEARLNGLEALELLIEEYKERQQPVPTPWSEKR
jgi:predicted RNase H-like HicB family nuclease